MYEHFVCLFFVAPIYDCVDLRWTAAGKVTAMATGLFQCGMTTEYWCIIVLVPSQFSQCFGFFFGLNWIKLASGACYPGWSRRFGEFATPRRGVVGPFRSVLMYSSCPSFSAGLLRRDGLKLLTSVTMSESIVIEQLKIDELEARLYNTCTETKFHIIKRWGRHTVTAFVWEIGIRLYQLKCIVDNQTGGRKIHQKIFCSLYTWYIIGANCSWVYLLSAT